MSANRSVQAAQRRRAGPTNNEPAIPGRGPQSSINSAQIFANQARPGSGPNIPNGRLAGQQAALQQSQAQQQSYQQMKNSSSNDKLSSVSKMTIPQAITLITLRLGAIESKMLNVGDGDFHGKTDLEPSFLQSIVERLDALEKRPSSASSSTEANILKQQIDALKNVVLQTKNSSVAIAKENVTLKTQLDNLKKELADTNELLVVLQNLTMDNSQKILDLSMNSNIFNCEEFNGEEGTTEIFSDDNTSFVEFNDQNEIIGTDLKQLIEDELNIENDNI